MTRGRYLVFARGDVTPMTSKFKKPSKLEQIFSFNLEFNLSIFLTVQNEAIYIDLGFVTEKKMYLHTNILGKRVRPRGDKGDAG